jgi:hypothetical protein
MRNSEEGLEIYLNSTRNIHSIWARGAAGSVDLIEHEGHKIPETVPGEYMLVPGRSYHDEVKYHRLVESIVE